ncbi:HlyD family secretion protein [Paraburkholderia sp. J12]|uniref:HlyD family secretion protein n=1 Tax=Paraburkholderia sp. J12 TaxID=2805432 RepID=UPI002ABDD9E6|nr:HlyD family efflux transporter periplasmic adaptor subunit [Paraburkholderia sp. J12]
MQNISRRDLFRGEVVFNDKSHALGEIVLVRPISFPFIAWISLLISSAIAALLFWGSYTARSAVSGQLVPDAGLIKIYAPQNGEVITKHVTEGAPVRAGDVLYVLSSDRDSSELGATQAAISAQIELQKNSLDHEIGETRLLESEQRVGIAKKISDLQGEMGALAQAISLQSDRVNLAEDMLARYQVLLAKDYISKEQLQQKTEDLLDQKQRLQDLERNQISTRSELSDQQIALKSLGMKSDNELSELDRNLASVQAQLTDSESKRRVVITAPISGTPSAVLVDVGQTVDNSRPLLSIVPKDAVLRAELYAPSRAIGFVRPGQNVLLRFQAYPYQKFGHQTGIVESVSRTALTPEEISEVGMSLAGMSDREPRYRIIVRLPAQTIRAYGAQQPLQAGMLIDADILQEKRRLYEWVLEPLYSLSGKL